MNWQMQVRSQYIVYQVAAANLKRTVVDATIFYIWVVIDLLTLVKLLECTTQEIV
ncbi:hypothetical protein LNK15_11670 [Jeotgalicoccus huakuii]|nr:hypothetical protein [Jeotgalicoccus huakuii]